MEQFDLRNWPGFVAAGGDPSIPAIIDQVAIDSRLISSSQSFFVALKGKHEDGHKFIAHAAESGAKFALVHSSTPPLNPQFDLFDSTPSSPITLLRVSNTLEAFQEIARCYRMTLKNTQIIGITGSFGKTMLKDLLQIILEKDKKTAVSPESYNSQLGVALSLFHIKADDEIAIMEAGISHKGEMDRLAYMLNPDYAIITNIDKAHISTLKSLTVTAEEKFKLLQQAPNLKWGLIANDPNLIPLTTSLKAPFYLWNGITPQLPLLQGAIDKNHSQSYTIKFPDGKQYHGHLNLDFAYLLDLINIAVKAAWLLGISFESICQGLNQYSPEPMSTEIWKSPLGVTFINDSYCSDPQSIGKAFKHFHSTQSHQKKGFVFGGLRNPTQYNSKDYHLLSKTIYQEQFDLIILYGQQHPAFISMLSEIALTCEKESQYVNGSGNKKKVPKIVICPNFQQAIEQLQLHLTQDAFVLIKGPKKEPLSAITQAFHESLHNTQCIINLDAIRHNIEIIKEKLPNQTRFMAIIKAAAYGTDDAKMAKFLSTYGVDILGVAYVEEGVALKRKGITQSIFAINAASYESAKVVKWGLEVAVSDIPTINALSEEATKQGKVVKVHLHVDTGMSRFGCRPEETLALAYAIKALQGIELEGIMTHFACSDAKEDDDFTYMQISKFEKVINNLKDHQINPPWIHAANSAGAIRFSIPFCNMVRVGLAIYGLYPSASMRQDIDLSLALSLTSRIVGINVCKRGETVSYGHNYTVTRDWERIAILPIGYFDGLHRHYSGKGYVIICGKKAQMVGNICMDFMMVDVTNIPEAQIGDTALIFGYGEHGDYISPENLAEHGSSIAHELITCLGSRIQRIFISN